jgi:hypothetical protein
MADSKFYSPFKIGLLIVTIAYVVFNLHTLFTTEWIGEWTRYPEGINQIILIEDINATACLFFRVAGSILALVVLCIYLVKKEFPKKKAYLVARIVIVFEGIYWLGLITSAGADVYSTIAGLGHFPIERSLYYFTAGALPAVLESVVLPLVLFIFAYKLSPNKPIKPAIKWGLISALMFIVVYWTLNTGIWMYTLPGTGMEYLTKYPQLMVAFLSTVIGLGILTAYSVIVTKQLAKTETLQDLNFKPMGVIVTGLGVWYLWNYLTYILLGGDYMWSSWWSWLLGHNMDLWMLSLPLVGLPLLFMSKSPKESA